MARESSMNPNYEIFAYVTMNRNRIISGNTLCLYAENEQELDQITVEIAKALKADMVQLKNKDYLVIRI